MNTHADRYKNWINESNVLQYTSLSLFFSPLAILNQLNSCSQSVSMGKQYGYHMIPSSYLITLVISGCHKWISSLWSIYFSFLACFPCVLLLKTRTWSNFYPLAYSNYPKPRFCSCDECMCLFVTPHNFTNLPNVVQLLLCDSFPINFWLFAIEKQTLIF